MIDFGIGKQRIEQSYTIGQAYTKQRSIVGKIGYAPHEQICMGQCFPSSDLYALGVTAIVLLTGKAPEVLIEQYSLEWRWRDYISVSWNLAQVLDKLLADKPKDRYQSAGDVLAALEPPIAPTFALVSPAPIGKPLQTTQAIEIRIKQRYLINPALIERCRQELTNCIGPIASFLIREVLNQYPDLSDQTLVEAIVAKIPNSQQAAEFRQRLL